MVQTHKGKAQAIRKGGKNATSNDKEGPTEDPGNPSQSARGRPISYGITSRKKLKILSHQLTEKRDTESHTENPMGFLTDKPQRGFHQEFGSSQAHSHTDIYKTNLHEDLQERTRNPTHTSGQPRQMGKVPKDYMYISVDLNQVVV